MFNKCMLNPIQLIIKARRLRLCLSTFGTMVVRGQGGGWGKVMLIKRLQVFCLQQIWKGCFCFKHVISFKHMISMIKSQTQLITKARSLTRRLSTFGTVMVRGQGGREGGVGHGNVD